MGLTLYRLGKWKEAIEHLESFRELAGSTEQHPVLADAHRALGNWADVDALWAELGEASPSAELVVEGRIVVAGESRPGRSHQRHSAAGAELEAAQTSDGASSPPCLLADLYDRAGRALVLANCSPGSPGTLPTWPMSAAGEGTS